MLRSTTRSKTPQRSGFTRLGSLTLAILVAGACGDNPGPVSPDTPPEPSLAAATRTPFTAMWTNQGGPDLPPVGPRATGNVLHFWNDIVEGPITGDLVGWLTLLTDFSASFSANGIKGPIRGTSTFALPGGTFEGSAAGIFDVSLGLSSGHFRAHGTGAYAGQKMRGTYTNEACLCFDFVFEGVITNPNP